MEHRRHLLRGSDNEYAVLVCLLCTTHHQHFPVANHLLQTDSQEAQMMLLWGSQGVESVQTVSLAYRSERAHTYQSSSEQICYQAFIWGSSTHQEILLVPPCLRFADYPPDPFAVHFAVAVIFLLRHGTGGDVNARLAASICQERLG
jgi:hypothetical protein